MAGIGIAEAASAGAGWWSAALAAAWLWFGARRSAWALAAVILTGFGLLHALDRCAVERAPWSAALEEGRRIPVSAEGLVADAPQERDGFVRFPLAVERLRGPDGGWHWEGRVSVRLPVSPAAANLRCGDRVVAQGVLARPEGPRQPGQFDFATYLRRQGFLGTLAANRCDLVERGAGRFLQATALRARDWLAAAITADVADRPEEAATIKAMVLGVREEMPEEINDHFVKSGTLHIFSVSGLHVALVAMILWRVLNLLGLTKRQAAWTSIPLVLFYALMTGWQPAAVRSAFMASVVFVGTGLNRPSSFFNTLCLAALLVLAMDPAQLFSPGAQLSFVVIASLVFGGGRWLEKVRPRCEPDPFLPPTLWTREQRWATAGRRWLAAMLCTSAAALLGSLPLTLWHFQTASPVALVANLLHVPLAGLILSTAGGAAAVAWCWPWLAAALNNANLLFAQLTLASAGWFAACPGGHFFWNPRPLGVGKQCRVLVFDAGDGGAALIRTPGGRVWLVDGGNPRFFRQVTRASLRYHGVEKLDGWVMTHGDQQHIGGAADLLARLEPAVVLHPPGPSRSPAFRAALTIAGSHARPLRTGDRVELDDDTTLTVLFPPDDHIGPLADDGCLVFRLEHQGQAVVFFSDAGFAAQQAVARVPAELVGVRVLVKGRHADDATDDPGFLRALPPSLIVAAGAAFPVGSRVSEAWKTAAEARGHVIFEQAETGAVELSLGPEGVTARGYVDGREWTAP